ncbi:IS66 family insertion sequence element accessory protein TnpB [Candidatus Sumerlaeota bacterium]|nr:IS66 family insertion sequence element accessory protein TnpB [Candidatus Sumerlaeota bacterium]
MISLPGSVKIYLCLAPADMRRGFDTLAQMAREVTEADPMSGQLCGFRSRRGERIKILYWDRDGMALWYKRLERGTFGLPAGEARSMRLSAAELTMILSGVELSSARRRRYVSTNNFNHCENISPPDKLLLPS